LNRKLASAGGQGQEVKVTAGLNNVFHGIFRSP